MHIDSAHFVSGKILEIGPPDDMSFAPLAVTLSGPDGVWGTYPHRVLINSSRRAEDLLRSDADVSDALLAETRRMRFVNGGPGGGGGHFVSDLAEGGVLEKVPFSRRPSSVHYLRASLAGPAVTRQGGFEVRLRERRLDPHAVYEYVFLLSGSRTWQYLEAGLAPGSEILARTRDLRPESPPEAGRKVFTGTGFDFIPIGAGALRLADAPCP